MARNSISISLYALTKVNGVDREVPCDLKGRAEGTNKVHGGRFKIRYREDVEENGVVKRCQRGPSFDNLAAALDMYMKVKGHLERGEVYEPAVRKVAPVANLDVVALKWLRDQGTEKRTGTAKVYKSSIKRIFSTIRALKGIAETVAVPASVLSIGLFSELRSVWKTEDERFTARKDGGRAAGPWRRYDLSLVLFNIWQSAYSQPLEYPGVPPCPLDKSLVLPRTPPRPRAPSPATWEEMDHIVRRAYEYGDDYGDLLLGERSLGLRVGQIEGIQRSAVNVKESILTVEIGKSEEEQAEQREVPIPAFLLAAWMHRIAACKSPDAYLFPASERARTSVHFKHDSEIVKSFFVAAADAGEVREGIFKPRTHRKCRTTHGLRAGFMSELESLEKLVDDEMMPIVPDKVIDFLVGHHPQTTRDRSYVPPKMEKLRRASARIPAPRLSVAGENVVPFPK